MIASQIFDILNRPLGVMKRIILAFVLGIFLAHEAQASNISTADPTYPESFEDIDSIPLRNQFDALINDIDNLWAAVGPDILEANQLFGALVSGKAEPLPVPSCFGPSDALIWIPGTGFSCNSISAGGGSIGPAAAYTVLAGPLGGSPTTAAFRALTGNDLPLPTSNSVGGVESVSPVAHEFINGISTSGVPLLASLSFTDITGVAGASQLPNPTASSLGGTQSIAVVPHNWVTGISLLGVPSQAQPSFGDISGNIAVSQMASGAGASSTTYWRGDGIWASPSGGGISALSALTSATTTNSIDNTSYAQTWGWSALGANTGLKLTTSMTTGTLLSLTNTNGASSTGYILNASNATTGAGYGIYSAMTGSGNSGYAGYFSNTASAATGYAIYSNGNSYLNGTTTVNGNLTITGTCVGCVNDVSVTAGTSDIVVNPSPGVQAFTVGTQSLLHKLASTTTSYTVLSSDMAETVVHTASASSAVTLPQAGTTGFLTGSAYTELNIGSGAVTVTPTTSTINGSSSLSLPACSSPPSCPWAYLISDGTNWEALVY